MICQVKKPEFWQKKLNIFWKNPLSLPMYGIERQVLAVAAAGIAGQTENPLKVIIMPDMTSAEVLASELQTIMPWCGLDGRLLLFPESCRGKFDIISDESARAGAVDTLLGRSGAEQLTVVGSIHALLSPLPPKETAAQHMTLTPGMKTTLTSLAATLVGFDYDDESEVSVAGEFARRGGIIDIWSPAEKMPCRIEFFGDEIDSMRYFDTATQRSTGEKCTSYRIITPRPTGAARASGEVCDFFDYICDASPFVVSYEPEEALDRLEKYPSGGGAERFKKIISSFSVKSIYADIPPGCKAAGIYPPGNQLAEAENPGKSPGGETWRVNALESMRLAMKSHISYYTGRKYDIVISCRERSNIDKVKDYCKSRELPENLHFGFSPLPNGFLLPDEKLLVLTDRELFCADAFERKNSAVREKHKARQNAADSISSGGEILSSSDLAAGDYAVHLDCGIGIYRGIRTIRSKNTAREVICMEFADSAMLYIPMLQADRISRYLGSPGKVTLSKISSSQWQNTKLKARRAIRSYAADLLRLQAVRMNSPGISYPPDGINEEAFAAAFPYQDTPDQTRAAAEIAADMSRPRPMDRLLCGDVGFGKTEVAMRAAFKAVNAGYQVALIAPTTVLVQQHYYSFCERFAQYPFNIDFISRLRTPNEQREILKKLTEKKIDIIIGTHKLCSKEVKFGNLGLLIIDEEQRFGVKQKEFLRSLRTELDVLSMSATPIPRTMYMAMAGARDLSTLMTPPRSRLPVKTIIAPPDDKLICEAVNAEISRGGQVYFLHNRIFDIEKRTAELAAMMPGLRFASAHGQLPEKELSSIMQRFLEGRIDCLVSTTIVESGLDVQNANTIIIENADRFGLSQLYQLRGRVGRWKHQSYAYLLLPEYGLPGGDGRKRLAAIRRCSQLGSGMQLALRDLEIRGAGNLLGAEQSGHLNAVGFDLYCRLLKMEVAEMKGEKKEFLPSSDVGIDFVVFSGTADKDHLAAAITEEYTGDEKLRFMMYRRLAGAESTEKLAALKSEFTDRFGKMPPETETLFAVTRLKILAARGGFDTLAVTSDGTVYLKNGAVIYKRNGRIPKLNTANPPDLRLLHLNDIVEKAVSHGA